MRLARLAIASSLCALAACDGGGRSPTEPSTPVSLEGSWAGSIAVTSVTPGYTCSLALTLFSDEDPQFPTYFGDWDAQCPAAQGRGTAFAVPVPFGQVIVAGVGGPAVFGGCGWSSAAQRFGSRLSGEWSTSENCQGGPVLRGRLELRKQG